MMEKIMIIKHIQYDIVKYLLTFITFGLNPISFFQMMHFILLNYRSCDTRQILTINLDIFPEKDWNNFDYFIIATS